MRKTDLELYISEPMRELPSLAELDKVIKTEQKQIERRRNKRTDKIAIIGLIISIMLAIKEIVIAIIKFL